MLTTRCGLAFPFFTDFLLRSSWCMHTTQQTFISKDTVIPSKSNSASKAVPTEYASWAKFNVFEALWFLFWTLVHCASLLAPLSLISFIPMGPAKATVSIQYRIVHSTPFYSVHHSKKTSSLHGSNTSRLLGVVEVVGSEKNGKSWKCKRSAIDKFYFVYMEYWDHGFLLCSVQTGSKASNVTYYILVHL